MNGLELRARREKHGLSAKELAERVGVGEDEIREWERTGHIPRKQRFTLKSALWELQRDRIMAACELPVCEWIVAREQGQSPMPGPEEITRHLKGCSRCGARKEYAERHVPSPPLGGGVFPTIFGLLDSLSGWRRSAVAGALVVVAMGGIGVPILLITGLLRGDLIRILSAFVLLFGLLVSGAVGGIVHFLTAPLRKQGRLGHYSGWILIMYGYLATVFGLVFASGAILGPESGDVAALETVTEPSGVIAFLVVGIAFGALLGHLNRAEVSSKPLPARAPGSTIQIVLATIAALLMLGGALLNRYGAAWSEGDWQRALPGLQEAVRTNPEDAEAHLRLADALLALSRLEEAIPVLETVVQLAPDDADARNDLGWTLNQFRRFASAVPVLQEAVRLAPDHRYAHHNLGWALANLLRFEDAAQAYEEATRVNPDQPDLRAEYGALLITLRRLDAAAEQFAAAIRLQPSNPEHHRGLGVALMQNGKPKEALAAFHEAAKQDPNNPTIWGAIAWLAHLSGEYEESDAAYQRTHELNSGFFQENPEAMLMWEASKQQRQYVP